MGNRASISVENCTLFLFLHWNGGRGSVRAFVEEANKRYTASRYQTEPSPVHITGNRYVMELYACIREYFNFSGELQFRARDGMSLSLCEDKNTEDNGHYHVLQNGQIDECDVTCSEYAHYTQQSHDSITQFFAMSESLMLVADWEALAKAQTQAIH